MDGIDALREILKTQGEDGNWNYSPYMYGLYNGLELAAAIIEDREPEFRSGPSEWLCTKHAVPVDTEGDTEGEAK